MKYQPKSLEWFIERIGKTIYSDSSDSGKDGFKVFDEQHARYLHMIDNDYAGEGQYLNYRDEK